MSVYQVVPLQIWMTPLTVWKLQAKSFQLHQCLLKSYQPNASAPLSSQMRVRTTVLVTRGNCDYFSVHSFIFLNMFSSRCVKHFCFKSVHQKGEVQRSFAPEHSIIRKRKGVVCQYSRRHIWIPGHLHIWSPRYFDKKLLQEDGSAVQGAI